MRDNSGKSRRHCCDTDDPMLRAACRGPAIWAMYVSGRAVVDRASLTRLVVLGSCATALPKLVNALARLIS